MTYTLTFSARDTDRASYYCIDFGAEVTVRQGAYDFMPSAVAKTMFAVWPNEVQAQFPPSSVISGSIVLTTTTNEVSGEVIVSPALNVPVTLTLWGVQRIGEFTLPAGETAAQFRFAV